MIKKLVVVKDGVAHPVNIGGVVAPDNYVFSSSEKNSLIFHSEDGNEITVSQGHSNSPDETIFNILNFERGNGISLGIFELDEEKGLNIKNVLHIDKDNGISINGIKLGDVTNKEYVDTQDEATLDMAKGYTNIQDAATLEAAKEYADTQDEGTLESANGYADTKDETTLEEAKEYADTKDATTLGEAKEYADTQDETTLNTAKEYADTKDEEIISSINDLINGAPEALDTLKELSEALNNDPDFAATITQQLTGKAGKEYVDTQDETTLDDAKEYADTQDVTNLTAAKEYADTQDETTLEDAKEYTDAKTNSKVNKSGDTMSGPLNMGNHGIGEVGILGDVSAIVAKESNLLIKGQIELDADYGQPIHNIKNVKSPVDSTDASNKQYVDNLAATKQDIITMPVWTETVFHLNVSDTDNNIRYTTPYFTGKIWPNGKRIMRVEAQIDAYFPSITSTPKHEAVSPNLNILGSNLTGFGGFARQQDTSLQPYAFPLPMAARGTALPSRFEPLIAYGAFQIYSINSAPSNSASGYQVTLWVEWHEN